MRRTWILLAGLMLLSRTMAITIDTIAGEEIDWIINEFGVELYPVVIDAATGARNRIPDFGVILTFLDVGMFSPSFDLKDVSKTPPFLNVTLADAPPNVTKTEHMTEDGTRVSRITQESILYNRLDGKKFVFRVHFDSPDAASWVEYCGFKLPLRKNGVKLTVEWDNFLTHNETTNSELPDPVIYTRMVVRAKTKWNTPVDANVESWPIGLVFPFPEVKLPRLPGFPAWGDYPSVRLDSKIKAPQVGVINIRDDRLNVTFESLFFGASNYTGSEPNPSPNGLNPVDVSYQFWPPSEMQESFLADFALTNPPDGIRSAELPILFYSRPKANKHLGPKVIWDPDLSVVFKTSEPGPDGSQMNMSAVVGGVLGGVIAVALIAIVVIFIIRRRQSAARKETLTRINATLEDGSASSRSTTTDRSSSRSSGWDRLTIDNRVETLKSN